MIALLSTIFLLVLLAVPVGAVTLIWRHFKRVDMACHMALKAEVQERLKRLKEKGFGKENY